MKKFFMLAMMLCNFVLAKAQTEAECFQYIKKLDVPSEVMALPNDNPANFWWYLPKYNTGYQKFETALKKGKSTAHSAVNEIKNELMFRTDFQKGLTDENSVEVLDSVYKFFNLKVYNPQMKVFIVGAREVNAYSTPDAIILLNSGLLNKMGTFEKIYAVVGHELAHYALGHVFQNLYAVKKKEKRNKIMVGVAYGIQAAGTAIGQAMYSDNSPEGQKAREQAWQDVKDRLDKNLEWATVDAYGRYHLKYSRNQEVEADIASYRFLQWIGEDPNYMIKMLEILGEGEPKIDQKDSDHPSTSFRINVLKAIAQYDEARIANKVN
ncbi:MAG: hypothetical protein EGR07_03280 [Prevotella sp.]|nr:hypothetical protein [Prevotella sp.]